MKGEKAPDNYKELKGYGTDQTYLARKIMTERLANEYVKRGRPAKGEEKVGDTNLSRETKNTNPGICRRLARHQRHHTAAALRSTANHTAISISATTGL